MKKLIILLFVCISCRKTNVSPLSYTKNMAGARGWTKNELKRFYIINGFDTTFHDTVINSTVWDSIKVIDDSNIVWNGVPLKYSSFNNTERTISFYYTEMSLNYIYTNLIVYYYSKDSITLNRLYRYKISYDSIYSILRMHTE